jgi:hypothetical protein
MRVCAALAIGLLAALGCGEPERQPVTVSARAPAGDGEVVAIPGAELTLLPFDIDSLYAALEERNQAGPPPAADTIQDYYQAFYQADTALPTADSLLAERVAELDVLTDRTSEAYRKAFAAYERAQTYRDSLSMARDSAEARYAPLRDEYNRARAQWEASAWDGFAEETEELYGGVPPPEDSAGTAVGFQHRTGQDGSFTVHLAPGPWWVAGRVPVPRTVNELYRWNVPFTVGEEPVRVELTGENAETLFTY